MLKKIRIGRMLLLIVVVVIANLYFGCVNKYYPPNSSPDSSQYQTKQETQIKEQETQIKALQKEIEELKKQK
jgi:Skp family chaperone for outer membrane proteins